MTELKARRTTGVSSRHGPIIEEKGFPSRFHSQQVRTEPASATTPPRPHGDPAQASIDHLAKLVHGTWDGRTPVASSAATARSHRMAHEEQALRRVGPGAPWACCPTSSATAIRQQSAEARTPALRSRTRTTTKSTSRSRCGFDQVLRPRSDSLDQAPSHLA